MKLVARADPAQRRPLPRLAANTRRATGETFARQLELCTDPRCEQYLLPAPCAWRCRLRPKLFWLILAATVLPSIFAAVLNFTYNHQRIISQLSADAERYFMWVQTLTNATAFPLGLSVMAWQVRSTLPGRNGTTLAMPPARKVLDFGRYAAWICIVLWTLAGLTYPLSMRLGGFQMPVATSGHFFFSLLLCGLFAVSLNFFGVTTLALRFAIPCCWERGMSLSDLRPYLHRLTRSCWLYLSMSAAVPMITTSALVTGNRGSIGGYLVVTSLGGAAAFIAVLCVFRTLLHDIETLTYISHVAGSDPADDEP